MAKEKIRYACVNCGYISAKWLGRCPECSEWNTMEEEMEHEPIVESKGISGSKPLRLEEIEIISDRRTATGNSEFDRVLGGGVVEKSLILVGGDPGIGKSTILLQIGFTISEKKKKVLYVSGEESPSQIKMRASRLDFTESDSFYILSETNIRKINSYIEEINPDILIIDSIQTIYSEDISSIPGSVSQVREITSTVMRITKSREMASFIIGHVTKQGAIAGPKLLEHMVDTVLYFEGDNQNNYRILRSVKNRFGSTNEIGVFEMSSSGLKEVTNPSRLFMDERREDTYGAVVTPAMEGTRPFMVEIQSLIAPSGFGSSRRLANGYDSSRVSMLMAVLEKKLGIQLISYDSYINVIGGIQLKETAADLAVVSAVLSSFREKPLTGKLAVTGEVGLTGEIRGINSVEKRILESMKLGFGKIIIPESNYTGEIRDIKGIEILPVGSVSDLMKKIFL